MRRYAELEVATNFSFLRGGSHPEELVSTAKALELEAIAVTDRNTLAGIVRAHLAAREVGIKFVVGVRLDLQDAPSLLVYPTDRAAYGRLCRLLTLGQRRAEKGECTLYLDDVASHADGLIFIALPPDDFPSPGKGEGRGGGLSAIMARPPPGARCAPSSPFQGEESSCRFPLDRAADRRNLLARALAGLGDLLHGFEQIAADAGRRCLLAAFIEAPAIVQFELTV